MQRRTLIGLLVGASAAILATLASFYLSRGTPGILLVGVVPAVIAGSIVRSRRGAVVIALIGTCAGLVLASFAAAPPSLPWTDTAWLPAFYLFVGIPFGSVTAYGTRARIETGGQRIMDVMLGLALALTILSMWGATLWRADSPGWNEDGMSTSAWLASQPDLVSHRQDADLYLRTYQNMKAGQPYYEAVFDALQESHPSRPVNRSGAVEFRLPTLYWLWAASPFDPRTTFVGGLLTVATLAVISAYVLGRAVSHPALALTGAACVAAFYAFVGATAYVTHSEPWTASLVLGSIAAWSVHRRAERDTVWLVVSVVLAFLAASSREIAVYVIAAGCVAAFVADRSDRRRRLLAWATALAGFGIAYALHVSAVGGGLIGNLASPGYWVQPSLARTFLVVDAGEEFVPGIALSLLVAAFAVAGVVLLRDPSLRALALLGVVVPLGTFCVVGPRTVYGEPMGYWALLVMPCVLAFVPAAVRLLRPFMMPVTSASGVPTGVGGAALDNRPA